MAYVVFLTEGEPALTDKHPTVRPFRFPSYLDRRRLLLLLLELVELDRPQVHGKVRLDVVSEREARQFREVGMPVHLEQLVRARPGLLQRGEIVEELAGGEGDEDVLRGLEDLERSGRPRDEVAIVPRLRVLLGSVDMGCRAVFCVAELIARGERDGRDGTAGATAGLGGWGGFKVFWEAFGEQQSLEVLDLPGVVRVCGEPLVVGDWIASGVRMAECRGQARHRPKRQAMGIQVPCSTGMTRPPSAN